MEYATVKSWEPYLLTMCKLPTGEWAGVKVRMYNTQILIGLDPTGYRDAY
jgi:hypothetical protein